MAPPVEFEKMLRLEGEYPLPISSVEYIICKEFGWDHRQFVTTPAEVISSHLAHMNVEARVSKEKDRNIGKRSEGLTGSTGSTSQRGSSVARDQWEKALAENEGPVPVQVETGPG